MNNITSCQDMISAVFSNLEKSDFEKNGKFNDVWKKIITSIKSYNDNEVSLGQNLYEHSRVVEEKNGILLIETDHPGWSQMLQMRSRYILKGISMYLPEFKIQSLAFKIRGSNVSLCSVNYEEQFNKEREIMNKKIEMQENELKKFQKNDEIQSTNVELPAELLEKFASLKESMLTKKENK